MPEPQTRYVDPSRVDHPHAGWWVAVLTGMGVLAILAFHARAYGAWCERVTAAFSQPALRGIFAAAVLTHLAEAVYALRLAQRAGLQESAPGWFLQTVTLGYPSLRLLLRRVAAAQNRSHG